MNNEAPAPEQANIQLRPVNSENWKICVDLSVALSQEEYVAENWYALLEWKFSENPENIRPYCVYADDLVVGFIMYGLDRTSHRWILTRFMIDARHQGNGYGKKALQSLLDIVRETLGSISFYTCIDPQNEPAIKLYESAGFEKTGEVMWHDDVMRINL